MKKLFITYKHITLSITISICFLSFRIITTQSFYFAFLMWNLFLSAIPFFITSSLLYFKVKHKIIITLSFFIWLLFLPNAPYIITDLAHIKRSLPSDIWLDLSVIFVFALTGLLLFYKSLSQMKKILNLVIAKNLIRLFFVFVFYLIGFGIYLGREFRYNSWDTLNPKQLVLDCLNFILKPLVYYNVWEFTMLFGTLLWMGYVLYKKNSLSKKDIF